MRNLAAATLASRWSNVAAAQSSALPHLERRSDAIQPVIDGMMHRLHASEERFRRIVETVRDHAIFTINAEDRIDTKFPGAEAVFG
jgi:hypothetical protein